MARFAIEQYVDQKNQWAGMFGGKKLSLLNKEDRQRIADSLDADLSPENLTCDGELSAAEVRKRHSFLTRAAMDLKALDPNVEMYGF